MQPEIGTVLGRACFEVIAEAPTGLKNAGVVREQAEQQPHQINFQRVARVPARLQLVVEPAHPLCGLDVDRVVLLDLLGLVAGNEAEAPHLLVEVL